MFYVYVITDGSKIYIGWTRDLKKRLIQHNTSRWKSYTKRSPIWKLIYYEAYYSEKDARDRERKLKYRGRTKVLLKRRLRHSWNEVRKVLGDSTS